MGKIKSLITKVSIASALCLSQTAVHADPTAIIGSLALSILSDGISSVLSNKPAQPTLTEIRKSKILKARTTWEYINVSKDDPNAGAYAKTIGVRVGDEKLPSEQQRTMSMTVIPNVEGGYYIFMQAPGGFDCDPDGCFVGVQKGDDPMFRMTADLVNVGVGNVLLVREQSKLLSTLLGQKKIYLSIAQPGGEVNNYYFINRKFNINGVKHRKN